jgi:hypothetical protein
MFNRSLLSLLHSPRVAPGPSRIEERSLMAKTRTEREQDARQAKLDHVSAQVASGQLVIREMSTAERARWAKQNAISEARATPVERARRATALENRRRRAARLAS